LYKGDKTYESNVLRGRLPDRKRKG
jgi:hypothetical protein